MARVAGIVTGSGAAFPGHCQVEQDGRTMATSTTKDCGRVAGQADSPSTVPTLPMTVVCPARSPRRGQRPSHPAITTAVMSRSSSSFPRYQDRVALAGGRGKRSPERFPVVADNAVTDRDTAMVADKCCDNKTVDIPDLPGRGTWDTGTSSFPVERMPILGFL